MKLGEVVVSMGTTTSPSFIKIGLETKKFSYEPVSGTFECGVNNRTVEVHRQCMHMLHYVNSQTYCIERKTSQFYATGTLGTPVQKSCVFG